MVISLRLVFAFAVFPALTADSQMLNTEPDDYDKLARSLVNGHGYVLAPGTAETMQRLPLYPVILAGIFAVFGEKPWPVQVTHALIDGVTALLVFRLAGQLFGDRTVSLLAVLLFATYPGSLVAAARIVTEPIYVLLLLVAITLFLDARRREDPRLMLATGLVLGVAALCKSTGLFLPVYLGVHAKAREPVKGRAGPILRTTVVLIAGTLLVLSPWIIRNYLLIGHVLPTSTIGGTVVYDAFFLAKTDAKDKEFFELIDLSKREQYRVLSSNGIPTHTPKYPFWFQQSADEYRWDRLMYSTVLGRLRDEPTIAIRMITSNALGLWFTGRTRAATLVAVVFHGPLLIVALLGLHRAIVERRRDIWVVTGVTVYFSATHALLLGMVRYSIPVIPFVLILAAKGLRHLWADRAGSLAAP